MSYIWWGICKILYDILKYHTFVMYISFNWLKTEGPGEAWGPSFQFPVIFFHTSKPVSGELQGFGRPSQSTFQSHWLPLKIWLVKFLFGYIWSRFHIKYPLMNSEYAVVSLSLNSEQTYRMRVCCVIGKKKF
jgi:hypothetical protein